MWKYNLFISLRYGFCDINRTHNNCIHNAECDIKYIESVFDYIYCNRKGERCFLYIIRKITFFSNTIPQDCFAYKMCFFFSIYSKINFKNIGDSNYIITLSYHRVLKATSCRCSQIYLVTRPVLQALVRSEPIRRCRVLLK